MCVRICCFHGHTPKVSAFGHGMCQNSAMVAAGLRSRNQPRQKREVIVLHQDQWILRS